MPVKITKVGKKYKIEWYENTDYIEASVFVEKALKEDWSEWINRYEDWLLKDIRINYSVTIEEFYENE